MEPKIKHFSEEERKQYKEQFPGAEPKEWALTDTEVGDFIIMSFHDTEQEAKTEQEEWMQQDLVEDAFCDWVKQTASAIGIERDKVLQFVSQSI